MTQRTGSCRDCGAETISGERGRVPTICRGCYLANERAAAKRRRPPGIPRQCLCQICGLHFFAKRVDALYCAECKRVAHARAARGWIDRNPGQRAAISRRYYESLDPEIRRDWARQWATQNRDRKREHKRRRRARESGAKVFRFTEADWNALVARFDGRCAYCGAAGPLERDHVVPLSRGGDHGIGNILPACIGCNRSKLDRLLVEWRYAKALRQVS